MNKRQTSPRAASAASKVLRDGRTSKASKTAAGSATGPDVAASGSIFCFVTGSKKIFYLHIGEKMLLNYLYFRPGKLNLA